MLNWSAWDVDLISLQKMVLELAVGKLDFQLVWCRVENENKISVTRLNFLIFVFRNENTFQASGWWTRNDEKKFSNHRRKSNLIKVGDKRKMNFPRYIKKLFFWMIESKKRLGNEAKLSDIKKSISSISAVRSLECLLFLLAPINFDEISISLFTIFFIFSRFLLNRARKKMFLAWSDEEMPRRKKKHFARR